MELPAPPPRDDGDAHRLAGGRERGRIEDDLDRRDGAQAPPQVDDRSFAPPRPRRVEGGERLHEPPAVDRVDDLLGKRVRPLRRRLPDSLPAVDAPRLRPPQELLDEFSNRTTQGGSRASSIAALEVRRRHLRDDGPFLVEELHNRVALHLRLRSRQFIYGGIRPQEAVRNGARLEPPHHGRKEVFPLGQLPRGARVGQGAYGQRRTVSRADGRLLVGQPAGLLVDRALRDAQGGAVLVPGEGNRRHQERDDRRSCERRPSRRRQVARRIPLYARAQGLHGEGYGRGARPARPRARGDACPYLHLHRAQHRHRSEYAVV